MYKYNINSEQLNIKQNKGVVYVTFPSFEDTSLVNHAFSTKIGGVSTGIFESLNLGYNRGDAKENVDENFKRICKAINVNQEHLIFSNQVHEDKIYKVTLSDIKKNKKNNIIGYDALITNEVNIPLVTFYADCVPIFLLDPVKKVIGLSHAGWRGTVKKIPKKTINKMVEHYNSNPKDILAGIAPSIGPCCYEVGEEVANEFRNNFSKEQCKQLIKENQNNKYILNLWKSNFYTLIEAGLQEEHITITDLCTMCNSDVFFSHRATKGQRGSLAAIMALRE